MIDRGCDEHDLLSGSGDLASRRLGIAGFHALWRGERPMLEELATDPHVVEAMVGAGRLEVDDGRLIAAHGLVARTTRHRIHHALGTIHTWCAFDAIGIPAALGIDATAETTCPTCDAILSVQIHAGDVCGDHERRLWLPAYECTNLIEDFCKHANLYCGTEHLTAAIPPNSAGEVLDVTQAADLGRRTWNDVAHPPPFDSPDPRSAR